ncbi:hypothetical protein [Candidatus Magnetobacterium casense]|uniref:Uncharacterized protein n=1 Tax=Candidatus Magnetobacterium casense TaxID=1455061 RepID=A0ABS6RYQ9_9BACT|nr:hypothetical protein [Candidatus Magnetobacterium casensis]MBV6341470.1 hypothetical protein [Candidatus Magnetobacterium casensis]
MVNATKHVDDYSQDIPILTTEQMKEDIVWFIKHRDYVSFAEIINRYGEQAKGEESILNNQYNIILWANMSSILADSILSLIKDGDIHKHPASLLTYLADGMLPTFPMVRRLPRIAYKSPRWLPVCFRPGASCGEKECPHRQLKKIENESRIIQ